MTTVETQAGRSGRQDTFEHLVVLARLQAGFRAAIGAADPAAPVPACGDWTVRELVEHLAEIHHWAAALARAEEEPGSPAVGPDLAEHYGEHAAALHATLTALGPDARSRILPGLTPDGHGPSSFWARRQVHETLVHLHDLGAAAAGAAGLGLAAAEPEVWADTVDEVVTVMQPRQVGLGRMAPLRHPVLLVADDVPGARSWVLGFPDPDRAREVAPDVLVSGTAEALALVLWRRLTPAEAGLTVMGDRKDLDAALGQKLVP